MGGGNPLPFLLFMNFKVGDRVQLLDVTKAIVTGTVVESEYNSISELDEIPVKWDHLLNLYDTHWRHSMLSTDRLRIITKLDKVLA